MGSERGKGEGGVRGGRGRGAAEEEGEGRAEGEGGSVRPTLFFSSLGTHPLS